MASNRRAFLTGGVLAGGAALATPALSTPRAPEYLPDAVFPEPVLNFDLSVLEQARAATVEIFPEDPRTATGHRVRARHGSGFLTKVDDLVHAAILTPGIAVVTNSHVVDGRETMWVRTFEGQVFEAPVRYDDAARDVAIIASPIEAGLSTLKLVDMTPAFGAPVAALGAPFGYTGTVTRGFINNTTVTFRDDDAVDYLQHDAAIGHGSSGGPLLNADGEVIGINTAIPDDSVGFAGIGLATPAKHIHEALSRAHENRMALPWLGLQLQQISPEIASAIGWENRAGLLVAKVQANSPAAAAGIKAGDIIADAENTRLNTLRDFGKLLLDKVPGQTLDRVSVHRLKDGRLTEDAEIIETLQIEWRTSKRQHSTTVSAGPAKRHLEHGINMTRDPDGACRVQTVAADSAADLTGIETGDRIELFAMRKCGSPEEFDRLWKAAAGDTVPVLVRRGEDRPLYITLPKAVSNTNRRHVGNTTTEISAAY